MKRLFAALTAVILLGGAPSFADSDADVVVLPFEDLTGAEGVSRDVSALVIGAFTRQGWTVASPEPLEELLRADRVRYLDFLEGAVRSRILRATNSRAVVTGTIYQYSEGRNPTVALSVRLVTSTGALAWSNVAVVSASETEGLFGFGRQSTQYEVAVAAVKKLMEPLPKAGGRLQPMPGPEKPPFRPNPTFHVASEAIGSAPKVICILPFANESRSPAAARVVTDLLTLRLAAAPELSVIDGARLRSAVLEIGLGSLRRLGPEDLELLATEVGTPLFLQGTVYEYEGGSGRRDPPELSVELTLQDARTGRTVWVSQHERNGSDYEGLFLLGAEVSAVGLADRVVSEMVHAAEEALQDGRRAESAGLAPRSRSDLNGNRHSVPPSRAGGVQ